jgi:hypothetical protein
MGKGRLEALIRVPTGGWAGTIDDSDAAGAVVWTLAAGTYYLPELLVALAAALNLAAPADTITVAVSNSETGTGKVTITSSGNGTLEWTDPELRDLLGYTGNLTLVAATANTAANQACSLWLADCPYDADNEIGDWLGWRRTDAATVMSAAGAVFARVGQSHRRARLFWTAASRHKAVEANESTTNESFEKFLYDGVWGFASWGQPTGPIRFFPDADEGVYVEYAVVLPREFAPQKFVDGWAGGPWTVGFEELIVQSSGTAATPDRATISVVAVEASDDNTDQAVYTTGSQTPTANKLQVLDILATAAVTAETPTSVVGCGLTWVLVDAVNLGAGTLKRLSRWRALGPAPSTGSLTITFANTMNGCLVDWKEIAGASTAGANGSGAIVQTVTNAKGAALTVNATLAALEHASNVALAAVGININDVVTPDADFAEVQDNGMASPVATLESQWAEGETACDPTFASAQSAIILSEIKAAFV